MQDYLDGSVDDVDDDDAYECDEEEEPYRTKVHHDI